MASQVRISFDNIVNANATDVQQSNILPIGKIARLMKFGGSDRVSSDGVSSWILIQWGDATGGWTTIRALAGCAYEYEIKQDFIGDGVKRFRLVRQNKSNLNKELFAFLEAIVLD